MISNPGQVIVATENYLLHSVHGLAVYHRDFPEVRGEGSSPEDAAVRLAEVLSRTLDSVPSDSRRLVLERAIEDVHAFATRDHSERLQTSGTARSQ